jgi:transcriptional regulator with XRE-family HTH domain
MLTTSAPSTFGDLLRHHRQAAGLTQHQLAERAGLSVDGIQKLERGATHPYRDTAQRLIAALQLDAEDRSSFKAAVAPVVDTTRRLPLNRPSVGATACR